MTRRWVLLCAAVIVGLVLLGALGYGLLWRSPVTIDDYTTVDRPPRTRPDYADCVIPANIAPLNFRVDEAGTRFLVRVSGRGGEPMEVVSRSGGMAFPMKAWRRLLDANRGRELRFDVYVQDARGHWRRFQPVTNTVAEDEIDPYVIYRDMPVYNLAWSDMGIYQRDLESFEVSTILHNRAFGHGCLNCHTFLGKKTTHMVMMVRCPGGGGPQGGMVVVRDGGVSEIVDTTTAFNEIPARYSAWHPSGKAVSFSTNVTLRCYHTAGFNPDVVDVASDALIYRVDTNTVTTDPEIAREDRLETYTTWSPDGRYMYYCSALRMPVQRYREIRYDLMRISYDIDTDTWGKPETLIRAEETGKSVTWPRFSPDGKWLLFCMSDYGNFVTFMASSDHYLMDMETGRWRRLAINTDRAESYHSWSSNSRWFVFSSKRMDGFLTRLFLCYVDREGRAHKPFLLPQEDPAFYESHIRIYNVPELVCEPFGMTPRQLAKAIHDPQKYLKAQLDPKVEPRKADSTEKKYSVQDIVE